RAIPAAAPARWPAQFPTLPSRSSRSRSRTTTKVQGWVFLLLPACRPLSRIRSMTSSGIGWFENRRTTRIRPTVVATGPSCSMVTGQHLHAGNVVLGRMHVGKVVLGCRVLGHLDLRQATRGPGERHAGEGPEPARRHLGAGEPRLQIGDPLGIGRGGELA